MSAILVKLQESKNNHNDVDTYCRLGYIPFILSYLELMGVLIVKKYFNIQ